MLFGTCALSLRFFEAAPLRALRRVGANKWLGQRNLVEDDDDAVVSPAALLEAIDRSCQWEDPALCASSLRTAVAICRGTDEAEDLFTGPFDRLPLRRLSARFRSAAGLPMRDACELIVSELLIGQHVDWAVGRKGDDSQCLKIDIDEGRWITLRAAGWFNPTPDRLYTLLEPASDCGLIDRADGGYVRPKGLARDGAA
ncbi:MAG TPA: hypothetical protein VEZ70_09115 [Allosphingosinicella sp.]|nr:hypothetical protein [Allosphingosinicella sp.]